MVNGSYRLGGALQKLNDDHNTVRPVWRSKNEDTGSLATTKRTESHNFPLAARAFLNARFARFQAMGGGRPKNNDERITQAKRWSSLG